MLRTIALSAGATALLLAVPVATPAFAHHPSGAGSAGEAGPIVTVPATTLEKGHSSAAVVFEYLEFKSPSDALLKNHNHVHSLDSKDPAMLGTLLLLLAAAAVALPAAAHSHKTKSLEIVHPWIGATARDATSARVFMIVRSRTGQPDRLIAASTARTGKVELHDAGKGAAAFSVGPGQDLVLYGDGPSLVLTGLKAPLQAYDDFKMTLVFERAGRVEIDVMVEE